MIVVDANIITYLVVESENTRLARALAAKDPVWRSPPLWRYELTSSIATLIRARALSLSDGRRAIQTAQTLMAENELPVDQAAVLETALAYAISAYDAQYVALAKARGLACVTNDGPLLRKTPGITVSLVEAAKT